MKKVGLAILYVVSVGVMFGGLGDLTVRDLFEVHRSYLLGGGATQIPPETSSLIIHLIHALGGGLVGIGVASFALVHFGLRRGQRWAGVAAFVAILCSEGMNAVGMFAVGSFWYVSLTYIAVAALGLALALKSSDRLRPEPPATS